MFIYLLWHHGEYGPEGLTATTDRNKILSIAEKYNKDGWFESVGLDPMAKLNDLLKNGDEALAEGDGIHNLMDGWGGLHIQVVKAI